MIRTQPAVLAGAASLLLGCAGSPPLVNACSLISSEDVGTILEVEVDAGRRSDDGITSDGAYSSTCVWNIVLDGDSPGSPKRFVILNAMAWPRSSEPDKFFAAFNEAVAAGVLQQDLVPLELGDRSFWWGDGVAVRKGRTTFGVSILMSDAQPEWKRGRAEQLAAWIVEDL